MAIYLISVPWAHFGHLLFASTMEWASKNRRNDYSYSILLGRRFLLRRQVIPSLALHER